MLVFVPSWISCKLGIDHTQSSMRTLLIQCFHVLIVLIAHQVERCISMLFLVYFFAQVFSLGQFTPCQACLLGSFWRRRKVHPWKKYTRAPCKIACTGKVFHENEHPQESAQWKPGIFETQASIFSTSFFLFRCVKIHSVTDLHFGSGFNSQTQYKLRSLNNGFPKWFWLHETIDALYFYKYNP